MSGPHLVEQSVEVAPNPPATDPAASDPAASLRAAALLTLKSKRRKATALTRPFVAPPLTIELDYGSEEPSGGQSSVSPALAVQPAPDVASAPEPMDVDDGQAREEGEISDSETTPPTPNVNPEPTSPKFAEQEKAVALMPPPPLKPKAEPMSPSLSFAVPRLPILASFAPASVSVDENHVRPGLDLTQAQYDSAKDTVLDLLGWGVPPEYLVNCGLSREIIFYVFVELNLRLPTNLDVTGLMPYMPPFPDTTSDTQSSNVPVRPQRAEPALSLSANATPFVPSIVNGNGSSPSLTDMEQQRKAELLARKAVLASRKLRPQKSSSLISQPSAGAVASNGATSPVIPTKTVDDFLNSIEPVGPSSNDATVSTSTTSAGLLPSPTVTVDNMDVDDDVPGLSGGPTTDYTPLVRPPSARSTSTAGVISPKSPMIPPSATSTTSDRSLFAPSTEGSKGVVLYCDDDDDDMDAIPGLFKAHSPLEGGWSTGARRGTKRPVAADFVDMEPGSARSQAWSDNYRPPVRRKTTGFAGVTQRRCVIDLTDSEGEQEEELLQVSAVPSRADSRGSKAATPPSVAPTPRVSTPTTPLTTPAALLEKEEQIRRMRELIAQRERQKKLALASRGTSSSDVQMNGTVAIKQEEDDLVSNGTLNLSRSGSSSTPEVSSNGRPSESQDERSVLTTLLPQSNGDTTVPLPDAESTSSPTTPIDVLSTVLEHPATGDKVLTDEAQQEQAVVDSEGSVEPNDNVEVDVVGIRPETSAQVETHVNTDDQQTPDETPAFVTYRSVLDSHPLLRAHSHQDSASVLPPPSAAVAGSSSNAASFADINLTPLKQAAVLKYLSDNEGRVCQYDIGGECRDKDCENIHLSKLSAVEPSDEDTAQYLCSSIPAGQRYGPEVFMKALDLARLSNPAMPFGARVQEALSRLGLR